ncbi:hypothetical protein M378DRAFT_15979 [Amanita muscaria Koide BX008]|uniref:Uncharacterized protein n=1 Tax=Amanita muscaria (strain Koide BX008) TaxID=946122 RepID=A0A0C2WM80_AMAMK|nr:hypothetical protein M378DRAFT_15979 [Amanita muscaria Koide BX008]
MLRRRNFVGVVSGRTRGLEKLETVCLVTTPLSKTRPGTRKTVLKRLRHRIDNPNPTERIFWLHGPPGVGKSAIADKALSRYSEVPRGLFSEIASNRGLDPTWPGQEIIEEIVFKSSGSFVLPSTLMGRLSDEDYDPETELDVVRGLKPHGKMSPLALLDGLYLEILGQQRDQDFLKTFLALLVGHSSSKTRDLHRDDAVSAEELHIKLRKMRSLLKFEPFIDVHSTSFLDFLQDSFRSGHHHVSQQGGLKRYSQLIVDSVVRHVSMAIGQPDCHETCRSSPEFTYIVRHYPPRIVLPVEDWKEALRPLLDLQDKLLNTSRAQPSHPTTAAQAPESNMNETVIERSSALMTEAQQNIPLDRCLSVLLSCHGFVVDGAIIDRMSSLLAFDYAETAARVRSISDVQKLINIIGLLANNESFVSKCGLDAARKVAFLGSQISQDDAPLRYESSALELAVISRILDHNYVLPHESVHEWLERSSPDFFTRIRVMLEIARTIRYIHSMDIALFSRVIELKRFALDSNLRAKVLSIGLFAYGGLGRHQFMAMRTLIFWPSARMNLI